MNFNKMICLTGIVFLQSNLNCVETPKDIKDSNVSVVKKEKYKGKQLKGMFVKIFNGVLVSYPTTTLRMTAAAQRAQVILNNIENLKPVGVTEKSEIIYFDKNEDEKAFIKEQLRSVLEPVEKFFENIQEHMNIVKKLLSESLTDQKIENSIIYKVLSNVRDSFLNYSCSIIATIPELEKAATEFVIFFEDIKASMDDDAKKAFQEYIKNNPNVFGKTGKTK